MQTTVSAPVETFEPHQLKTAAVLERLQVDIVMGSPRLKHSGGISNTVRTSLPANRLGAPGEFFGIS